MGNLVRDPEVKYLPRGTPVAEYSVAITETWRNDREELQEKTHFFDCVSFGQAAEYLGQYGKKGNRVFVDGKLQLESWDDQQTGQKRSRIRINGAKVHILERPPQGQGGGQGQERRQDNRQPNNSRQGGQGDTRRQDSGGQRYDNRNPGHGYNQSPGNYPPQGNRPPQSQGRPGPPPGRQPPRDPDLDPDNEDDIPF